MMTPLADSGINDRLVKICGAHSSIRHVLSWRG